MDIRINSLSMRNFKGTPERKIIFNGRDANIYGDNATGKTSIADAFSWVLFDKNSLGVSSFEIKPIGLERPEVEVVLVLSVDGKEIELKKTLTEKWTKKHGDTIDTLTGNESRYWINQIEKKQSEYKNFLDGIISEKDFRMLANAEYFLSLKKPDMRNVLIGMAGDIPAEDIAGKDQQLMDIVRFMQDKGYSIDDLLKLCKQNIALYSTEQQNISPRIDEVRRMLPQEADYSQLEAGLVTAKKYIKQIDERLSSSRTAALEANRKQLDIVSVRNKIDSYARQRIEELNKEFYATKVRIQQAASAIQIAQSKVNSSSIEFLTAQLEERRKAHKELSDEYVFLFAERKSELEKDPEELSDDALICDKCGQNLPADKIEMIKDQALRVFQSAKESRLKVLDGKLNAVIAKGQTAKDMIKAMEDRIAQEIESQGKAKREVKLAQDYYLEISTANQQQEPIKEIDLTGDPVYEQMKSELTALESSVESKEDKTDSLLASKAMLESQVAEIVKLLNGKEEREKGLSRITDLTERGKTLSGLIAFEKSRQFQAERFIRARAEMLESNINSMFENISFRLFDIQINGGIVDDCEPLIQNVPYRDASNSERIRGSQEIVKAMQRAKGITIAYFMDNCEAATWFVDMDCQTIKLFVSEQDKFLRIVVDK